MSNEQNSIAQSLLDSAAEKSRRRDDEGAIADLTQAIQLRPDWVEAYLRRAIAYFNKGDRVASLADAQEAVRIEPENVDAQGWLSVMQQMPNSRSEALQQLRESRHQYFMNSQTIHMYGFALGKHSLEGSDETIVHDFDDVIQSDPAKGYFARGNFYDARGEREKAVADYTEAIRFDPNFARAYWSRAMSYGGYGHFEEAISDYTRTLELYEQQQEHDYNKAIVYFARGSLRSHNDEPQQAIADLSEAIRLRSDYANAYFERGSLREDTDDLSGAIADYTASIEYDENPYDKFMSVTRNALYNRGRLREDIGDLEGAIADWQQYLDFAAAEERERGDQAEVEEWIREAKIKLNQK